MKNKFLKWLAFKLRKHLTPYLPEKIIYRDRYPIAPLNQKIEFCTHKIETFVAQGFITSFNWKEDLLNDLITALDKAGYVEQFTEPNNPARHEPRVTLRLKIVNPKSN